MMWSYVVLAYLSLFVLGLGDSIRGPLYSDILNDFSLNDSNGAWFYAMTSLAGIAGGYIAQKLMIKFDRIQTLIMGQGLMAVALLGMGLSNHYTELLVFAFLLGTSIGIIGVAQNILASIGSSDIYRRQVLSGLHTMYGLSSFLAPLLVNICYQFYPGWRGAFFVVSFISFALTLAASVFMNHELSHSSTNEKSNSDYRQVGLSKSYQYLLAAALGCYVLTEIMVSSRLARYMRLEYKSDLVQSGYFVTMFFLMLMAGRLLFVFIQLPFKISTQMLLSLAGTILCLFLGLYSSPWFFVASGFTMAPFYPLAIALMSQAFPGNINSAVAISIIIQSFFIVSMHLGVGALTDLLGIRWALVFGPVASVVAFAMVLILHKKLAQADVKKDKEFFT